MWCSSQCECPILSLSPILKDFCRMSSPTVLPLFYSIDFPIKATVAIKPSKTKNKAGQGEFGVGDMILVHFE